MTCAARLLSNVVVALSSIVDCIWVLAQKEGRKGVRRESHACSLKGWNALANSPLRISPDQVIPQRYPWILSDQTLPGCQLHLGGISHAH